jgi:pyruvate dehydrogenase E2 component (dihydrolipoamide acetyltransferase)
MISEVVMPQMGADMTEGTIVRWLKAEGDPVERGEIIAEIETDKANVEIEAFESGIFRKTIRQEGDVVPVEGVIAIIAAAEDDISRYESGEPATAAPRAATVSAPASVSTTAVAPPPPAPAPVAVPSAAGNGRMRVSPVARRIADERGIDLRQVHGTGPDGRIVKRDLEQFAAALESAPPAATAPPRPAHAPVSAAAPAAPGAAITFSKMRQAIARRMSASKREAPHYYLLVDIDMTAALAFRKDANASLPGESARISINDMIVRACALALQRHPAFNVSVEGDVFTQQPAQNVCIAIAMDDGLIAPAVLDTGSKTLAQIALATKDLIARANGGSLKPDEITAGTFSITNLGAYGIETLIGIIQPPQTAILGVGSVAQQPVARDGQVVVRDVMKVALSADHRVTDGALGAQFLGEIKRLLEQPLLLVL